MFKTKKLTKKTTKTIKLPNIQKHIGLIDFFKIELVDISADLLHVAD